MSEESKKIKIALVINDLLLGGAQVVVRELAKRINRDKFEVKIYVLNNHSNNRANLEDTFMSAGIQYIFLFSGKKYSKFYAIIALYFRLISEKIDLVHCHLPDAVFVGGVASILSGKKFIIHEHQSHKFHSWKIRFFYKILRPFSTLTICYGENLERELFGSAHILRTSLENLSHRTGTIFNGVDTETIANVRREVQINSIRKQMGCTADTIVILSVGRLVEWKGHTNLIYAFIQVAKRFPKVHLCVVGEGSERSKLEELRESSGSLSERIHLLGARQDIPELLLAADIFSLVFAYQSKVNLEPIGIAGLEAMAAGLPVVVGFYNGAQSFIKDGVNGRLVVPCNPEELARVLAELVSDEKQRRVLGEAAKSFIEENMSWDAIMPIYERVYLLAAKS